MYRFTTIPTNNPVGFIFSGNWQTDSKIYKKNAKVRIVRTTLKNIHLIYCYNNSDHVVLTQGYRWNETKSPEKERHKCGPDLPQRWHWNSKEKMQNVFSINGAGSIRYSMGEKTQILTLSIPNTKIN